MNQKANLMNTDKPTVQVMVFKFDTIRQDWAWVLKDLRVFKTKAQALRFIERTNAAA